MIVDWSGFLCDSSLLGNVNINVAVFSLSIPFLKYYLLSRLISIYYNV